MKLSQQTVVTLLRTRADRTIHSLCKNIFPNLYCQITTVSLSLELPHNCIDCFEGESVCSLSPPPPLSLRKI